MKSPILVAALLVTSFAWADEKYAPPAYWLSRGYHKVKHPPRRGDEKPKFTAHSLKWPVKFQDPEHQIGNSMAEFQNYGDGPYYHGGCDLRVSAEEKVYAPIAGRLEAGHYGYSNNPDGSSTKYWTAWPGDGDAVYFEVAVVTDDGFRFEFHHMNADQLPPTIIEKLKSGTGRIEAGELLGQTIYWPSGDYHHTHANIYTPSGVNLNPEYYYEALPDHVAPQIQGSYVTKSGAVVIAVNDQLDQDAYVHPPVFVELAFDSGQKAGWDFRERLQGPDGKFPPIWNFYLQSLTDSSGNTLETSGGYGEGLSLIQVPVPQGATGAYTLRAADQAGNMTTLRGKIGQRL